MEKLSITVDVTKVNKDKIVERRFFTKDNKEVVAKDLKLDVVPLREPKLIKEGDTWAMWKTHFVAIPQTTEEREQKVKSLIVGDGIMFKTKQTPKQADVEDVVDTEDIDPSLIPF